MRPIVPKADRMRCCRELKEMLGRAYSIGGVNSLTTLPIAVLAFTIGVFQVTNDWSSEKAKNEILASYHTKTSKTSKKGDGQRVEMHTYVFSSQNRIPTQARHPVLHWAQTRTNFACCA